MEEPLDTRGVIIVGGGVAGVTAAFELRKGGFRGRITLLDAGTFPHDRPPLTKDFLWGHAGDDEVALYSPAAFEEQAIDLSTHSLVTSIDLRDLGVVCEDGSRFEGDFIVLATGGLARIPAESISLHENVHRIRTIDDARRLKRELTPGRRLLVIGGGLLGVELSYTARLVGVDVTIVEPQLWPLTPIVGDRLAHWLHDHAQEAHIAQHQAHVVSLAKSDDNFRAELSDETVVECDVIVAAIGFEPAVHLAVQAGLDVGVGIEVDACQRTSDERVFAIGDCAERHETDRVLRGGHWEAAKIDGERVARSILGESVSPDGAAWFWTDRGDLHLDVVGRMDDCDETVVRGEFGSTAFSVIGMNSGRVAAAACVNDPKTARQLRKIIDAEIECTPDELCDPETDPRRILKR